MPSFDQVASNRKIFAVCSSVSSAHASRSDRLFWIAPIRPQAGDRQREVAPVVFGMPYRVPAERLGDEPSAFGADPVNDESQLGFVARLATRQGGYTGHTLAAPLAMPVPTNRFCPDLADRMARFAGTNADRVRALSHGPVDSTVADFPGRAVPFRMLDLFSGIQRPVCSACLAESAHHRCWWDIQAISACPVHGRVLTDACPRRQLPLLWRGTGVTTSSCGCELDPSALSSDTVPEDERAGRVRHLSAVANLNDAERVELLFRLGLDPMGPGPKAFPVIVPADRGHLSHQG